MANPPRRARLVLFGLLAATSSHYGCVDEVVLFRPVDAETPAVFSFAPDSGLRTMVHGDPIGTMFDELCPEGEALRGYSGFRQGDGLDLVTGLQAHCGKLSLGEDGTTITVEPSGSLDFHGETGPATAEWMCPANEVIVGIWGNAGTSQDGVAFYCAPLSLVDGTLTMGARTTLPQQGGDMGTDYDSTCADGRIARGDYGSWVVYLHSFGLNCATLVVE